MSSILAVPTYRFSVAQYYRMSEVGILKKEDRVELLNGAIVMKAPFSGRHGKVSRYLLNDAFRGFRDRCLMDVRSPLLLDDYSLPEPDFALLHPQADERNSAPLPVDVLLLVEIADASLTFDIGDKRAAYACAGISEYWVVDLTENQLSVFREPSEQGYRSEQTLRPHESIAPLAFPDEPIALSEVLAP